MICFSNIKIMIRIFLELYLPLHVYVVLSSYFLSTIGKERKRNNMCRFAKSRHVECRLMKNLRN